MRLPTKVLALAAGVVAALSAAAAAQQKSAKSNGESISVGGYIDWVQKSDVSALTEGVIHKMELRVGDTAKEGDTIGNLHAEKAKLAVAKAKVAATSVGAIQKGEAAKALAIAELARMQRANRMTPNVHSQSEIEKGEAEVKVALAQIQEAKDNQNLAKAELDIATQLLKEHTIEAPFDGIIIEQLKHPGESVRANEPVVRMAKVDVLKFFGDVPIQNSYRIRPGMLVDVTPDIEGVDLPIEHKRFRGKITYVSRETIAVNKTVVTVFAEVLNNKDFELQQGLKATMVVYLNPADAPPPPADMLPEPAKAPAAVGLAK
jgi:RND family efflux transporter MFP subunit